MDHLRRHALRYRHARRGVDDHPGARLYFAVDLSIPSWTNSIGGTELGAAWQDPDYDPALRAFYYARVIEIPTPRWTAHDAVKFDLDLPPEVPLETQERAYSSPIWYTPN